MSWFRLVEDFLGDATKLVFYEGMMVVYILILVVVCLGLGCWVTQDLSYSACNIYEV